MIDKQTHKKKDVIQKLAAYFLLADENNGIENVRNLGRSLNASLGLISQSIAEIENLGGVVIERRGQLGSYLKSVSIGKLWEIAVGEPLVIAHTLPSNRRYEGLAAAIKRAFSDAGIEAYFIFIRGSRTRIKALHDCRCHIAITSLFAAQGLCKPSESVVLTLPVGSFVKEHQVFTRHESGALSGHFTAAVDPDSYDQIRLTEIEFQGKDVEFKQINFMNILQHLESDQVDAAIWTEDDMQSHLGDTIYKLPLSTHTQEISMATDTQAALVARTDDAVVAAVIKKVLIPDKLIDFQRKIIAGAIIPEY